MTVFLKQYEDAYERLLKMQGSRNLGLMHKLLVQNVACIPTSVIFFMCRRIYIHKKVNIYVEKIHSF